MKTFIRLAFSFSILLLLTSSFSMDSFAEEKKAESQAEAEVKTQSSTQATSEKQEPATDVKHEPEATKPTLKKPLKKIYAEFDTSMGKFKARLFFSQAPKTVENFIGLAEGTKAWLDPKKKVEIKGKPFYDGLLFFAVRKNLLVQTGDPTNLGSNIGSGVPIQDEYHPDLTHWKSGMISMANRGPNTAESQFFISLKDQKYLDGKNVVFGEVIDGLTVLEEISQVPTDKNYRPKKDVVLKSVKIIREY